MATLNHQRDVLRLIDDVRKARTQVPLSSTAKPAQLVKQLQSPAVRTPYNELVHNAAIGVLRHVGQHRDVRAVAHFLTVVDEKDRRLLGEWFEKFGPVRFVAGDVKYERAKSTHIGEALETPYWKSKRTSTPASKNFDLADELAKLVTKAQKRKAAAIVGDSIPVPLLVALERLR